MSVVSQDGEVAITQFARAVWTPMALWPSPSTPSSPSWRTPHHHA